MDFGLLHPKDGYDPFTAGQAEHEWRQETTVRLGPFSVYVLDPHDDENYMHSARFPKGKDKNQVRLAMVFRWLTTRMPFYTEKKAPPLLYAMCCPDAKQKLLKTKQGNKWIRKLGL
jgi:hypothetical protein